MYLSSLSISSLPRAQLIGHISRPERANIHSRVTSWLLFITAFKPQIAKWSCHLHMSHLSFIGDVTVLSGRTFTDVHRTMFFFSLKQFAELFSFVFWWSASRHLPLGGISKSKCSRKQKSKRLLPRLPPRLLLEAVWPIFLEVRIFIWPKSDVCLALSLGQKWSWIHAASPKVTQPLLDDVEFNCWICQNCYIYFPPFAKQK